jgi:sigma-B regulation protein RsbU (phosphoserine phosphatase)
MRRLLDSFDRVFDSEYRIGGARLRDLLAEILDSVEVPAMPEFGTDGDSGDVASKSDRFVRFYYRPHLFPGMEAELRLAHQLQFHLLPRSLPESAPVAVAAVLESYCHLSGDLFGWEKLRDGSFLIWMADMAGHGVESGLCAAVLKILIDRAGERGEVAALAGEINSSLHASLRDRYSSLFATGFFLSLRPDGSASYCSAGHPPALLRRKDGTIEELASLAPPVGMMGESTYESRDLRLDLGDALLLYTDGLVETKSRDGEEFGIDRVRRLLARGFEVPEEMTGLIYREIATRQDLARLEDDVTFLVLLDTSR